MLLTEGGPYFSKLPLFRYLVEKVIANRKGGTKRSSGAFDSRFRLVKIAMNDSLVDVNKDRGQSGLSGLGSRDCSNVIPIYTTLTTLDFKLSQISRTSA